MSRRSRLYYGLCILGVIGAGLGSRAMGAHLPPILAALLPDGLWALTIFLLIGSGWPAASTYRVALAACSFCYLIELSQLYHAPWIDALRSTTLGGLILGWGFLWTDLVAYTLGIAAGTGVEMLIRRTSE